jgi:putative DNA primase/helicase
MKLDELLGAYQSNAYPAIISDFAAHLGVKPDSLRRLGLGWAPVVEFRDRKTGKPKLNFQGWLTIPERDANANPVGLSLRSQDDMKVMLPGSKHGLVYEVNPNHSGGEKGYSAGPQNWVRTMDAGLLCAVCGKPDGCLLSAENPSDPNAVVCIRVKEGSAKALNMGHLHLRKPAARLKSAGPLPDSEHPVLVVEGMTDTAAAMDLGFVAVGRPSNLACMDTLRDLLRGRPCVIVGENDRKADGREPGKEGATSAFETLRRVCRNVTVVMPPPHVKDLRAWVVKQDLTREEFLEYVAKHGASQHDDQTISDDRPTTIAAAFLRARHKDGNTYTLRFWEQSFFKYSNKRYRTLPEDALTADLHDWSEDRMVIHETAKGPVPKPFAMTSSKRHDIRESLMSKVRVECDKLPSWINGASGPDPRDLIVFANGILHVPAYFAGEKGYLLGQTPDLFTLNSLPFAFGPSAECPIWLSFLTSSLGDEQAKIDLLQEWIGYCMTPDTSMQKMMFFRGPTAAGKGRILEVIQELVGSDQVASPTFADLGGGFGLAPLMGKLVCLIGDARSSRGRDAERGLETLLRITGNDSLMVNRKFKDALEGTLATRVTIASNGFLNLPDHHGAMLRRLNIIDFTRSFKNNPDHRLPAKLKAEVPGIAVWALEGLRRLRENGAFTQSRSMKDALKEWGLGCSPLISFVSECCEEREDATVGKHAIFDAWIAWARERHATLCTFQEFSERLRANSVITTDDQNFRGLDLQPWAAKRYLMDRKGADHV